MPRKRKAEPEAATAGALVQAVPELSPLEEFRPTTKATKGKLLKIQERIYLKNVEGMLEETFMALRSRIRRHDMKAIALSAEINGIVKGQRGTTINNNLIQANSNRAESSSESASRVSFESLARKLDARDAAERESQTIEVQAS